MSIQKQKEARIILFRSLQSEMDTSVFLKLIAILLSVLCAVVAQEEVLYVTPNDGITCPDQPCFTLNDYAESVFPYFNTGSTFVFLDGNHTLSTPVRLANVSNITFRGQDSGSNVYILQKNWATFEYKYSTNLTIERLRFILNDVAIESIKMIKSDVIRIIDCVFQGGLNKTSRNSTKRALYLYNSTATIQGCIFKGNIARYGGAIHTSMGSYLHISRSIFIANSAHEYGGVLYALHGFLVNITDCVFIDNTGYLDGGALYISTDTDLAIARSSFIGNSAHHDGGAIYASEASVEITGANQLHSDSDLCAECSTMKIHERLGYDPSSIMNKMSGPTCFCNNKALFNGGAAAFIDTSVLFKGAAIVFKNNSAKYEGGGLYLRGLETFVSARYMSFINNTASHSGGGIYSESNSIEFGAGKGSLNGSADLPQANAVVEFIDNQAEKCGGGLYGHWTNIRTRASTALDFIGNAAQNGGGICIVNSRGLRNLREVEILGGSFTCNTAEMCGAAIFIESVQAVISFEDVAIKRNSGSAVCLRRSENVTFARTTLVDNTGPLGGAINSMSSTLSFMGHTEFESNVAAGGHGGAIYSLLDVLLFQDGSPLFANNTADNDGGALYAFRSDVTFGNGAEFSHNLGRNGGAMYFTSASTLSINTYLATSHNHALEYGGAIYYEDAPNPVQCNFEMSADGNESESGNGIAVLPYCFMRLRGNWHVLHQTNYTRYYTVRVPIDSYDDTATTSGNFLFGGLLDRCLMTFNEISNYGEEVNFVPFDTLSTFIFNISSPHQRDAMDVSSDPYEISFCDCSREEACTASVKTVEVYRGQEFNVSLISTAQGGIATSSLVTALASNTSRLEIGQNLQILPRNCSDLTYTVYSREDHEILSLSPEGPCHNAWQASAKLNVTFLPCPDAFVQSDDHCICEERLRNYNITCIIDRDAYITKEDGSSFWMRPVYDNGSYQGLVLYDSCPRGYCKDGKVVISLDDPDTQCSLNRRGVLCGACATNYSLMFGSSRCGVCSNTYLLLLLPFAAAGVVLVVFLSFLRLTVATGMINSIILYANIVQVNKHVFFPPNQRNVLTVFIAWMNLDLGFDTCFYDGMDGYTQTWLLFAFPLYIWLLISLIIVTSRYSLTVSKLIGHNPIAVLATLLLMSYTKILKSFIDVSAFADLDYPNNVKAQVWLKDGNVPYLESKHLALILVTVMVFVFLFVPYTLLLLLGYKLYRFSDVKLLCWLNRIKPLLDSYYAPSKSETRCWTGFLLIIRCALYVIFSFNCPKYTSLAITVTFTAILMLWVIIGRVYEKFPTNVIEVSIYFNLVALSAALGVGASYPAIVYSLVGIVFGTMIGIILYHFFLHYLTKWLKCCFQSSKSDDDNAKSTSISVSRNATELRESLLDKEISTTILDTY